MAQRSAMIPKSKGPTVLEQSKNPEKLRWHEIEVEGRWQEPSELKGNILQDEQEWDDNRSESFVAGIKTPDVYDSEPEEPWKPATTCVSAPPAQASVLSTMPAGPSSPTSGLSPLSPHSSPGHPGRREASQLLFTVPPGPGSPSSGLSPMSPLSTHSPTMDAQRMYGQVQSPQARLPQVLSTQPPLAQSPVHSPVGWARPPGTFQAPLSPPPTVPAPLIGAPSQRPAPAAPAWTPGQAVSGAASFEAADSMRRDAEPPSWYPGERQTRASAHRQRESRNRR